MYTPSVTTGLPNFYPKMCGFFFNRERVLYEHLNLSRGYYMDKLELVFKGGSDKDFKNLENRKVQEAFAVDMEMLMNRLRPLSSSKALNGLGKGVFELRKNGRPAYRLVYTIKDDKVYVLHVYSKTSDGTPKAHEETIKKRYKTIT
jgi:phage-related protein